MMKRRTFLKGSAIVGLTAASSSYLLSESGLFTVKSSRKVRMILDSDRTKVGTLPIIRAFAENHLDYVSPYVLLDEFGPIDLQAGNDPLRVDAHPHAGVTPTTYFLEGSGHHKDSLNYDFQIGKGEFMLFSSGRGAIHMEETGQKMYEEGGQYHGFQIWLNMPAQHKFSAPTTAVHNDQDMPIVTQKDFTAKVVLGSLLGVSSNIPLLSPAFYYHVTINKNGRIDIPTDPNHNAFIYMIKGEVELEEQRKVSTNQVVLFERGDSMIRMYAKEGAECLVLGGQPLNEPVFSYGPFVMNTEEQIKQCIMNYRTGKMGNPEVVNQ
ncbi:MAG: pirin-like C-terminal cupin domain-containing protein [Bacteroidota bacterium]